MRPAISVLLALAAGCSKAPPPPAQAAAAPVASIPAAPAARAQENAVTIDHTVQTLDGASTSLASYRGKALLIVNTASQCGYTPQYAGLEKLHETYGPRGLAVLGFPCNDFGGQEPGSPQEIKTFCETRFAVKFPLFGKVKAKGAEKSPLYRTLTEETPDGIKGEVKWNFTKFLVDPQGHVVARFEPGVDPSSPELIAAIERVLPH